METVKQVSKNQTYINWQKVAAVLGNRTKQQCKSLYQVIGLAYKSVSFGEQVTNNYNALSYIEKAQLYYYPLYYKLDFEKVRLKFPNFSKDELQQYFQLSKRKFDEMAVIEKQILNNAGDAYDIRTVRIIYNDVRLNKFAVQMHEYAAGNGPKPVKPQVPQIDELMKNMDDVYIHFLKEYRVANFERMLKFCEEQLQQHELLEQLTAKLDQIVNK